ASTMEALRLLQETELLDAQTADFLAEAYLSFRKIEHRIQIDQQLQTHELPKTAAQQEELARRMGYRNNALQSFLSDLDTKRKLVEDLFSSMFFHSAEEILQQSSPLTKRIIEEIDEQSFVVNVLRERNFKNPDESYAILKSMIHPHGRRGFTEKGKELLERLAPLFLDEILESPDPQHALISLDRYIDSLHSSSSYFSTFLENPTTARFLVRILGESLFFTDLLTHHPQIIDSLIGKSSHSELRDRGQLESDLDDRLENCEDYESELDALRRFKHEQILSIGVRQLWGEIDSPTARGHVTELAETCLSAALDIARKEMFRRYGGDDEEFPFATLGLGKLGGREMTYLSDLDVIFIYQCEKDKMGRLFAHDWFTRLATRIISILSAYTAEGRVFELDTRLRPSGNKGPLVSSLNSFRDYHRNSSQLWERQALIRARPIVGPDWLQGEITGIVRDCLTRNPFSEEDLLEIARLRERMEQEIAVEDDFHVDLKTGQGGLVDIEFFVQGNILKYSRDFPEIIRPNTLDGLRSLHDYDLIHEDAFTTLKRGYRFLINIEDRLRLMEHRSVDRLPLGGEKLTGLAQRLGYGEGGEARLLEDYFRTTRAIRQIYREFFGQC
ncbi:MAG: [glutamine synthetase] adenylyltransferase / [glutamine synthetase]-adenylyl-L-tyrosine, partial [Thermodesulfobacteriota bacterium]|nr:[glutamine synthetase] adenylyltransferase / [glutamine synthetase]-adenylyl-L-tyrosine [Thermodesulfobacteriota bacterium]